MSRIGGWFKRGNEPLEPAQVSKPAEPASKLAAPPAPSVAMAAEDPAETRSTFIRPWSKREQTVEQLQTGVAALSDLLGSVRDNLERTSKRQDELVGYLSHLPEALQSLPETGRVQGEALKAIQKQMERQTAQQGQVANVLERISKADDRQQRTLEALQDRVDWVNRNEHSLSQSLGNVGILLESMSKHSEASAQVLVNLRDGMQVRDRNVEKILHRQGVRFTTMLVIAIFLSMAALVAVSIFGYLGYDVLSHVIRK
ncbi:MAG TPA: hypothetical protein VH370_18900 [Humisphaera sp.]|nr:hypothetical protein [Humisphaera sp.]